MTDNTQPEALRLALSIDLMDTFTNYQQEELNKAAAELRRQHARIAELEAQLEAVVAGGVQALSAAPADIAKLRHLYANLKNGGVRDTAQAKRIADGLLAPIIESLEQAAPKAAPGVVSDTQHSQFLSDVLTAAGLITHGKQCKALGERLADMVMRLRAAPQQEAQEPCPTCAALARTVMLDQVSFDRKPDCYGIRQITDDEGIEEWEDIRTSPDVAREEANDMMATGRGEIYEVVPLWTTPQPSLTAKAADSVLEDAARYRFLAGHCRSTSEHWGGRWSIIVDGPAPKSHDSENDFDEAVDAARKQGDA